MQELHPNEEAQILFMQCAFMLWKPGIAITKYQVYLAALNRIDQNIKAIKKISPERTEAFDQVKKALKELYCK